MACFTVPERGKNLRPKRPPFERPIMCLAIGYPDMREKVPYSQKLPLDELRSYNRAADGE